MPSAQLDALAVRVAVADGATLTASNLANRTRHIHYIEGCPAELVRGPLDEARRGFC